MLRSEIIDPKQTAKACIIWLHGLGANAADLMGVTALFTASTPVRHVFMNAPVRPVTLNNRMPMQAWYDIVGLKESDRDDRPGILESEKNILAEISAQQAAGFSPQNIYLFGFSQGGAMALVVGLRSVVPLGGIAALSSYLPLKAECEPIYVPTTPIFMAAGERDMVVFATWTRQSYEWIATRMSSVCWKQYPMEHVISYDEMNDLSRWFDEQVRLHGEMT